MEFFLAIIVFSFIDIYDLTATYSDYTIDLNILFVNALVHELFHARLQGFFFSEMKPCHFKRYKNILCSGMRSESDDMLFICRLSRTH